jgi:hypothetical protein
MFRLKILRDLRGHRASPFPLLIQRIRGRRQYSVYARGERKTLDNVATHCPVEA